MGALLEKRASLVRALFAPLVLGACSSGAISVGDDRVPVAFPDSGGEPDMGAAGAGGTSMMDAAGLSDVTDAFAPPTAGDLVSITATCAKEISSSPLKPRPGANASVPICQLSNAIFWTSGLAVLCAGKSTTTCNPSTDPQFQNSTTAVDSHGGYLDAAMLPYVEISAPTMTFDYTKVPVPMGTVVAVVHREKLTLEYGVVGTVGQNDTIGDASYAMASSLGISPDPVTGGVQTNVITYIAFTMPSVVAVPIEDHAAAVRLGQAAAAALVQAGK
jgi:hypothetical protein